jgi:hypothetical protein
MDLRFFFRSSIPSLPRPPFPRIGGTLPSLCARREGMLTFSFQNWTVPIEETLQIIQPMKRRQRGRHQADNLHLHQIAIQVRCRFSFAILMAPISGCCPKKEVKPILHLGLRMARGSHFTGNLAKRTVLKSFKTSFYSAWRLL